MNIEFLAMIILGVIDFNTAEGVGFKRPLYISRPFLLSLSNLMDTQQ